jgi:hypothetical protein
MSRKVNTNKVSNNISSESGYYDEDPRLSLNSRSNSGMSMIRNNRNIPQINGNGQLSNMLQYNQDSDENSAENDVDNEDIPMMDEGPDPNDDDDCQFVPGEDDPEYAEEEYVEEDEEQPYEDVLGDLLAEQNAAEEAIDLTNDDSNDESHVHRARHNAQESEEEEDDLTEVRQSRLHDEEIIELSTINTQCKILFLYFYVQIIVKIILFSSLFDIARKSKHRRFPIS